MTGLARLLAVLDRDPDERLSINVLNGVFTGTLTTVGDAPKVAAQHAEHDSYYSTAALHPRVKDGRGFAKDVIGIRELYADLDVKVGGLPSYAAAEQVIADLSDMLGTAPVAVVHSGHGLQPHWPIERGPGTDWTDETTPEWAAAGALWRRWGRLVATVAERHGGSVDNVYDLSRVLRIPGTFNRKNDERLPVTADWPPGGSPVTLDRLRTVLDDNGVPEVAVTPRLPAAPQRAVPEDVVRAEVERALADLDELAELPEEARLPRLGGGWDRGVYLVAQRLVQAANSGAGYTIEQAQADFLEHAPASAGNYDRGYKWDAAVEYVGDQPTPHEFAEDVFGPVASEPTARAKAVEAEAERIRIREEARALVARERLGVQVLPALVGLRAFLDQPDDPIRYRVDGLWPKDGRVVLSAPGKAGKTSLTGNLLRCLVDGDRFLDRFDVEPVARVILLDNEMAEGTVRLWLRDQGILTVDAVDVVLLRGQLSTFNILDPVVRSQWAALLGSADSLIFDCLRPVLDALGLSEDKDAGRFLWALDELAREAQIREMLVVHHMGHTNERSRGDSRIIDWPDAPWQIVFENPEVKTSPRYFSAYGRGVEQPEIRLSFNPDDRHLTVDGGSRSQETNGQRELEILRYVTENPGSSQSAIERGVGGNREKVREALRSPLFRMEKVGQANHYYPSEDPE